MKEAVFPVFRNKRMTTRKKKRRALMRRAWATWGKEHQCWILIIMKKASLKLIRTCSSMIRR